MRIPLLLALTLLLAQPAQPLLTLEIRAFNGSDDVSAATRITIHRAGQRDQPVGRLAIGGPRTLKVPPGIYDAQAVHEQDGRVVGIRWAERLVVMPYPDEAGHHLEVINFVSGYGALELRGAAGKRSDADVALFTPADHERPAATAASQENYALFVVPVGRYDVQVRRNNRATWHAGIDVPLDRTRLWIVP
jgi:hypothetical protein